MRIRSRSHVRCLSVRRYAVRAMAIATLGAGVAIAVSEIFLLTGCSGSSSSSTTPTAPTVPWGTFRRDTANSGRAPGELSKNTGAVRFRLTLPATATASSPAIGTDGTLYLGTGAGLLSVSSDGISTRLFDRYAAPGCASCNPGDATCLMVGSVGSSPAVTANGEIVFQAESGAVFSLVDDGIDLRCNWVTPPGESSAGSRSSPVLQTDPQDSSVTGVFLGTGAGALLSLNGDGSVKWRRSLNSDGTPVTSSPAIAADGTLYITTQGGELHAFDLSGHPQWEFPFARIVNPSASELLPSPAVDAATYVTADTRLSAIHPDGTFAWSWEASRELIGSPAFIAQQLPGPTPGTTPTMGTAETPSPTPTPSTFETVVYVIDDAGTVYGIRGATGALLGRLDLGASGASSGLTLAQQDPASATAQPIVVIGTVEGFLYAATLDGTPPCGACATTEWENLAGGGARLTLDGAVRSAPVIDPGGLIYVTTAEDSLYAIGIPPENLTPTPTPTPTSAPANPVITVTPGAS